MTTKEVPPLGRLSDPGDRLSTAGDVALVTGAAGGIGRYVAYVLAASGATVALVDRDQDGLAEVQSVLQDAFDGSVSTHVTDITDESAVQDMVTNVADRHGTVDVLVNVAGTMSIDAPQDVELDTWNLVLHVNLTGTFLCCREAYPYLDGGGRVVNISSTAGQYGYRDMVHYAAAKSGIENLTRTLASAWAADNIRVNAVAPGLVYTPVTVESFGASADTAFERDRIDRSVGSPEEIADAVLFLASPAASYVSGETLTVGGVPPDQVDVFAADGS